MSNTMKTIAAYAFTGIVLGFILVAVLSPRVHAEGVQVCQAVESQINDELLDQVAAHGDKLVILKDANAYAFQRSIEEALGVKAPFSADLVAILLRTDANYAGIGTVLFAQDGCVINVRRFPRALVDHAIGVVADDNKPVGEKVD